MKECAAWIAAREVRYPHPRRLPRFGWLWMFGWEDQLATRTVLGSRIRQMREHKCWSQAELAELIATSIPSISRWERGTAVPSPHYRRKLCELFSCTPEELGFLTDEAHMHLSNGYVEQARTPGGTSRHLAAQLGGAPRSGTVATTFPLPHAVRLIGRDELMARLKRALLSSQNVAVYGLPGIGKTAAALALLDDDEVSASFPDGILWAPLGRTPNLHALLCSWGVALGVSSAEVSQCQDIAALERLLVATVGQRQLLFVADDVWSIKDALRFQVGGPRCAHLITTRMPEVAIRFAGKQAVVLREISDEDGVSLVHHLAPDVVTIAPEAIRALVTSVSGLPLALTLIGRHLAVQVHSGQPRRVLSALERLRLAEERLRLAEPLALVDRQPSLTSDVSLSLQAAIELSDHELDEDARTALYALSVFEPKPNSFSEDAALAVTGLRAETLDRLCDVGLLESCGPGRYTIHQTINDYARMHLDSSEAPERMLNFFTTYVKEHVTDFAALDAEATNILTAFQSDAKMTIPAVFVQGIGAIMPYLEARGLYDASEALLMEAQPLAAEHGDATAQALAWLHRGRIAALRGNLSLAESLFEETLAIARRQHDRGIMSAALAYWGEVALNRGAYKRAENYLHEGLELVRSQHHPALMAVVLRLLGEIADIGGNHEHAAAYYQEALPLARQIADTECISALLQNLGEQQLNRGNDVQARGYFVEGLAVARRAGHRQRMSALLTNLGTLALKRSQLAKAEAYFQQSLQLATTIENRVRIANALLGLGRLERARHRPDEAERHLREGLQVARDIEHPFLMSESLYFLGELYLSADHVDDAERAFRESVALVEAVEAPDMGNLSLYGLARVAAARGETRKARTLGMRAAERLRAEGDERSDEVAQWVTELPREGPVA